MSRKNCPPENTGTNEIRSLYKKMLFPMFVLNVLVFLLTLISGFSWRNVTGFTIGYIYMAWCLWYLGETIVRAVEMNVKKARHTMLSCYVVRFAGLFALCFAAFEFKLFSVAGILLPQLYPKAVLSFDAITGKNYFRKD